jgi:polysaccharide pyruvyl transferase WcaK-like protein
VCKKLNLGVKIAVLNEKEDLNFANEIKSSFRSAEMFVLEDCEGAVHIFKDAHFAISGRYHGVLLSLALETPTLALSGDPKITSACSDFLNFVPFPIKKMQDGALLYNYIVEILEKHEKIAPKICAIMQKSSEKTENALKYLI